MSGQNIWGDKGVLLHSDLVHSQDMIGLWPMNEIDEELIDRSPYQYNLSGNASAFSPTSLSGCAIWLDYTSIVEGGIISGSSQWALTWEDLTINDRDFFAVSALGAPAIVTAANGLLGLQFDEVNDEMSHGSTFLVREIFVVANYTGGVNFTTFNGLWTTGADNVNPLGIRGSSGSTNLLEVAEDIWVNGVDTVSFSTPSTIKIIDCRLNADQTFDWVLCRGRVGSRYWGGIVQAVIGYNRILNSEERFRVLDYLSKRLAVTVNQ